MDIDRPVAWSTGSTSGRVVDEALDKIDLTEIVLQQVDLIGVAEYVVAGHRPAGDHP